MLTLGRRRFLACGVGLALGAVAGVGALAVHSTAGAAGRIFLPETMHLTQGIDTVAYGCQLPQGGGGNGSSLVF